MTTGPIKEPLLPNSTSEIVQPSKTTSPGDASAAAKAKSTLNITKDGYAEMKTEGDYKELHKMVTTGGAPTVDTNAKTTGVFWGKLGQKPTTESTVKAPLLDNEHK